MHDLLFKNIFEFIKGELLIIQEILCLFSYVFSFLKFDIFNNYFLNLILKMIITVLYYNIVSKNTAKVNELKYYKR